ncbi:hypothetical protein IFM89_028094 [Coptis chinensis]|uniref:hydroxyethylthiazole kinase n=1 Tax=Coptis chinensis TaxID=261450 RepID=A0A835I0D4_9MAGN|nr:hypothetical protein IFM89_028094 [Coptis chinensis]
MEEKKTIPETQKEEEEEEEDWGSKAWKLITKVREKAPLIQCITNYVSMDIMANTLLASGASPAMLHSINEISDFTPHVHALCINIGTLSPDWLPSMKSSATLATQLNIPWVLDPVAVSASDFRLKACLQLVGLKPVVIRGNASEILALSTASVGSDKLSKINRCGRSSLKSLAQACGAVVAVSGAVDIITDGKRVVGVHNGVPMMQRDYATGCAVTALIAAFLAADPLRPFEATASALSIFGVAGEIGMDLAKGPASLRMHLIDSLHGLDQKSVFSGVNITSMP